MRLILRRVAHRQDGMAGVLLLDDYLGALPACVTLEPAWRRNQVNESCIPAGTYVCRFRSESRFGPTFEICDVPGRTGILLHGGNVAADTKGCILLGYGFDMTTRETMDISHSRDTFKAFVAALRIENVERFDLTIEDCWGGHTRLGDH